MDPKASDERPSAAATNASRPWCARAVRARLPGQVVATPLGIVHITKTSGTAFKQNSRCPDIRCTVGHMADVEFYRRRGMHSVAMLREPAEHFVSQFNHARFGTERLLPCFDATQRARYPNATAFATALRRGDGDALALLHANICGWPPEHSMAGLQSDWLDDPLNKSAVTLLCYDARFALARWYGALRALGSNCTASALEYAARTNAGNGTADHAIISPAIAAFARQHYAKDYALWQRKCARPGLTRHQ